jgi:Spy/CpxP family protein refolding chaperone
VQHSGASPHAPYAGEETREIKSLSAADFEAYVEGTGMGMAKPAELNGYPGPRHVLEHAEALGLTPAQRGDVTAAFERMRSAAVPLGERIVERERELDRLFADRRAGTEAIEQLTREIGSLSAQLRAVHLRAHVEVRDMLSDEQVERYAKLRGYAHAHHDGH